MIGDSIRSQLCGTLKTDPDVENHWGFNFGADSEHPHTTKHVGRWCRFGRRNVSIAVGADVGMIIFFVITRLRKIGFHPEKHKVPLMKFRPVKFRLVKFCLVKFRPVKFHPVKFRLVNFIELYFTGRNFIELNFNG